MITKISPVLPGEIFSFLKKIRFQGTPYPAGRPILNPSEIPLFLTL